MNLHYKILMTEAAWRALGEPEEFEPGERQFFEKMTTDRAGVEEQILSEFADRAHRVELEWDAARYDADARVVAVEES